MPWTIDIPEPKVVTEYDHSLDPDSDELDRIEQTRGGLAEMSEFYRQLGFEAGYGQAARDQLELSVAIAEQTLREHGDSLNRPQDARRLLYSFIARVDRRLGLLVNPTPVQCSEEGIVEGGLGI